MQITFKTYIALLHFFWIVLHRVRVNCFGANETFAASKAIFQGWETWMSVTWRGLDDCRAAKKARKSWILNFLWDDSRKKWEKKWMNTTIFLPQVHSCFVIICSHFLMKGRYRMDFSVDSRLGPEIPMTRPSLAYNRTARFHPKSVLHDSGLLTSKGHTK